MKRRGPHYGLFDLDDTMYPKSAGVMSIVSQRIDEFMALRLGMDEATIQELRPRYWKQYGTTMRGLLLEFGINPDDYLSYVHDFPAAERLSPNEELSRVLATLPWRKVIFTNSSERHTRQVLAALGVSRFFERIFDIEATGYVGKPDPAAYLHVLDSLSVTAKDCIALDDHLPNLRTARKLGMTTVWVGSVERVDGVDFSIARIEKVAEVAREVVRLKADSQGPGAVGEEVSEIASTKHGGGR